MHVHLHIEYRDTLKMLAGLIHLIEKLCIVHCGKEEKRMATALGSRLAPLIGG